MERADAGRATLTRCRPLMPLRLKGFSEYSHLVGLDWIHLYYNLRYDEKKGTTCIFLPDSSNSLPIHVSQRTSRRRKKCHEAPGESHVVKDALKIGTALRSPKAQTQVCIRTCLTLQWRCRGGERYALSGGWSHRVFDRPRQFHSCERRDWVVEPWGRSRRTDLANVCHMRSGEDGTQGRDITDMLSREKDSR